MDGKLVSQTYKMYTAHCGGKYFPFAWRGTQLVFSNVFNLNSKWTVLNTKKMFLKPLSLGKMMLP